ncbi:MAG: alpha/beta fold hydrolase [Ignavibacteriae bacterium]|jgi:pimeloyl-ACP methyl ester carboxylesterase|nr:prolyl oligopeptidase family serine peptidase [Ignavibacteriales bacterium]MBL1124418.1 alpha/beta fold hydrolase [Ignavibacteriota bacterium]MCC7094315.1 prolyl oligopeptidase family serine peptidase [Ignavibacteriaceae bacterium]MCE7857329.1 alpha/beta fold hydrolase [Ignavibacteria bacterium CHB3]MEB2296027.1 prolyl oligopeptidase family serine peptidase [Ignavibacteria bacterium]
MNKDFVLNTKKREKLRFTTYGYENLESASCLIFVHGFKGFKDWGFWPYSGNYFAERGYFVLSFNFSHNGIGNIPTEFTELDKFADNTFSLELDELNEILDAYLNNFFGSKSNKKIGIIGHSRGGGDSLIFSSRRNEINAVALWAPVANFNRYSRRQEDQWRKNGFFEVLNTRTNQLMRLNVCLLDDIEKNKDDLLNIEFAARNLNKPLLIIHGEQDLSVKIEESEQIYNWSDKNLTEFYKIKATGHTFDVTHPFEKSNPKFDSVLEKTLKFFNQRLN